MGYIQVYTGNGKGKTTCSLGLTLRAVGAGKSVYIGQFLKSGDYSEILAIKNYLPMVTLEQYGAGEGFAQRGSEKERGCAREGFAMAFAAASGGSYDVVILDEINVAVHLGLLDEQSVLELADALHPKTELVLTGRYAAEAVIARADLVTEMRLVKHYYERGVAARTGIEK